MSSGYLTMRALGRKGRWGNSVIQYAFLRTYAKRYNLELQIPAWAGRYFFGHQDPPVSVALPRKEERYADGTLFSTPFPPIEGEYRNHDFYGYAQYHTSYYQHDREFIQSLFSLVDPELHRLLPALDRLRDRGNTVVGFHLRRGDNGRFIFPIFPMSWYLRWLREHWRRLDHPVLFCATEDLSLVERFKAYDPLTILDLEVDSTARNIPPNVGEIHPYDWQNWTGALDYMPDWWLLANSDIVLCPDSTFSFAAAWLSPVCKEFWRAKLSARQFVKEDPWNTYMLTLENLTNYPNIPGTSLKTNPAYWGGWESPHDGRPEEDVDVPWCTDWERGPGTTYWGEIPKAEDVDLIDQSDVLRLIYPARRDDPIPDSVRQLILRGVVVERLLKE